MRPLVLAVCASLLYGSAPVLALQKAQIKRGPSYRGGQQGPAVIRIDKTFYSSNDRVRITVLAPGANLHDRYQDVIGGGSNGTLVIKTRGSRLEGYRLVETGPNTGVFAGSVRILTADTPGSSGGKGPHDGVIRSQGGQDGLAVYWQPQSGVRYSSMSGSGGRQAGKTRSEVRSVNIGPTLGQIAFDQRTYQAGSFARIRVLDPDMNLHADAPDQVPVLVFSESDLAGIKVFARESSASSGIFEAQVTFTFNMGSGGNRLRVLPSDKIFAVYVDATLPRPFGKKSVKRLEAVAHLTSYTPPSYQ